MHIPVSVSGANVYVLIPYFNWVCEEGDNKSNSARNKRDGIMLGHKRDIYGI